MWRKRIAVLSKVYTCIFTIFEIGENSAEFENQLPICQGAASLSGESLNDIQLDCLLQAAFTITRERQAAVNKTLFTLSKDLLYPRLY